MQFDPEKLKGWFHQILEDHAAIGGVTEIRAILPNGDIYSGLWRPRDLDALIRQLAPEAPPRADIDDWPRSGEAQFFWSLNPVDRKKTRGRRIRGFAGPGVPTVADSEIFAYRWIPIDLDPVRPKKTCATNEEKALAKALSDDIAGWLRSIGLTFLEADSGNGRHLLIPTRPIMGPEAIEAAKTDVRHLLWYLDNRFTNEAVQVDKVVFNPSRIWKLYGTLAIKGENTPERPHRLAAIEWSDIDWRQDALGSLQGLLEEWRSTPEWKEYDDGLRSKGSGGGGGAPIPVPKKVPRKAAGTGKADWKEWRREAIDRLNIDDVYRDILTGKVGKGRKRGWCEAQDPWSSSGSKSRSGQVANGEGRAEKGSFHTFRTQETISVFDYLVAIGRASDNMDAFRIVADLTGVPIPGAKPKREAPPHPADQPGAYGMVRPSSKRPLTTPRPIPEQRFDDEGPAPGSSPGVEDIEDLWDDDLVEDDDDGFNECSFDEAAEGAAWEEQQEAQPWHKAWTALPKALKDILYDLPDIAWDTGDGHEDALERIFLSLSKMYKWDRRPALKVLSLALHKDVPAIEKMLRNAVVFNSRADLLDPDRHDHDGKFLIEYTSTRDTMSRLFEQIGEILRFDERIFLGPSGLLKYGDKSSITPIIKEDIAGQLNASANISTLGWDKEDSRWRHKNYKTLAFAEASLFMHDPVAVSALPKLRTTSASPVYLRDWTFVGDHGYCPRQGGFLYTGPDVKPVGEDGNIIHLPRVLDGVFWKSDADFVNYLGALLTAITMPHWWRGHPCLIFNANAPGSGKSTLASLIAVLVDGKTPDKLTFTTDEEEMEKRVSALFAQGDRIIVVDNAKVRGGNRTINSPLLERIISDESPAVRLLGKSKTIGRPENDLLVCLTMNAVRLSKDMRRRALPINLQVTGTPRFKGVDPVEYATIHRAEILAELAGIVQSWVNHGRPMPEESPTHSTSSRWAATINAILVHNGHHGFLSNLEESLQSYDPRYETILEIIEMVGVQTPERPSNWKSILEMHNAGRAITHSRGKVRGDHSITTTIGKWFKDFEDKPFKTEDGVFAIYRSPVWDSRQREKLAYGIKKLSDQSPN